MLHTQTRRRNKAERGAAGLSNTRQSSIPSTDLSSCRAGTGKTMVGAGYERREGEVMVHSHDNRGRMKEGACGAAEAGHWSSRSWGRVGRGIPTAP